MRDRMVFVKLGFFLLIVIGMIVGSIWYWQAYKASAVWVNGVTITDKAIKRPPGEDTDEKYMVFTNQESFEVTDTYIFGLFNASDRYGKLEKGKRYDLRVAGWRSEWRSKYRNILRSRPAPLPEEPKPAVEPAAAEMTEKEKQERELLKKLKEKYE